MSRVACGSRSPPARAPPHRRSEGCSAPVAESPRVDRPGGLKAARVDADVRAWPATWSALMVWPALWEGRVRNDADVAPRYQDEVVLPHTRVASTVRNRTSTLSSLALLPCAAPAYSRQRRDLTPDTAGTRRIHAARPLAERNPRRESSFP